MPSCSSSMPSSKVEQTIASLGSPRILPGLSSASFFGVAWPSNSTAPARARTTFWPESPTFRFGAPVTIFLVRPWP